MRWSPGRGSSDIEDRRGETGGRRVGIPGGRMGLGGLLVLLVLSVVFKKDFFSLVGMGNDSGGAPAGPVQSTAAARTISAALSL